MESCTPRGGCCCNNDGASNIPTEANLKKILTNEDDDEELDDEIKYSRFKDTRMRTHRLSDLKIQTKNLLIEHETDPWEIYQELSELGTGAYGVVKKVCLRSNPETIRAIKIIPKENLLLDQQKLADEILILKNLDHPNIMKLYEYFTDDYNIYLVSEFCDQGDLLAKIEKVGTMNQIIVKFLMDQVFNAVSYLHNRGVLHGDIKLENIMLITTSKKVSQRFSLINTSLNDDRSLEEEIDTSFRKRKYSKKTQRYIRDMTNYEIKLIDFGCSKIFSKKKKKKISGIIGTSIYCSPEVISNSYDEKCDEWSCGILMYILLCGRPPFTGEDEDEIFEKIKEGKIDFSLPEFKNVSESCIDLIKKLLEPNINKRIKACDALKHPFFTESFNPDFALTQNKDLTILDNIVNVKKPFSKFHEAISAYLCSQFINKDEENRLRKVFRYLDRDGSTAINKDNLSYCLEENGYNLSKDQINEIFETLDRHHNGKVEYQEYLRAVCDKNALFSDSNLKSFFDYIDDLHKGFITSVDIRNFIFKQAKVDQETLKKYLDEFGMKTDDIIDFNKFSFIIKNNCALGTKESDILKKKTSKYFEVSEILEDVDENSISNSEENKDILDLNLNLRGSNGADTPQKKPVIHLNLDNNNSDILNLDNQAVTEDKTGDKDLK